MCDGSPHMKESRPMKEDERIEFLKKIILFTSLTDEELQKIMKKVVVRRFKKNQTILYGEDTNEFMYIILDGKVKAVQTTEDGKEIILAMHRSGDFFGELSLIDGKTVPASVMAIDDSVIALVSRKDFFSLLYDHGRVVDNFLHILCSRLRESWDKIQILSLNNASQRLKMLFLSLSNEYGEKTDDGVTLSLKLTHQEIANMAGLTRETVTRIIDKWLRDGKVRILKSRHILFSNDFLQKVSEL